jgi:simple sugar transport system ATP-binding protein
MATQGPLLEARGIVKRFGSVHALKGVDLSVDRGEVVALLGDNGAGKSTFVKTLAGVHAPDGGHILFDGRPVSFRAPADARAQGIETIYQDLALIETLDVAANVFLGRELVRRVPGLPLGMVDRPHMRAETRRLLEGLGIHAAPGRVLVRALSGGQRQAVAIARAIYWQARLLIMDEPTAALGVRERALVLSLVNRLREQGVAIIVVSHNLEEILPVADRVVVLRQGHKAGERSARDVRVEEIVQLMLGGEVAAAS